MKKLDNKEIATITSLSLFYEMEDKKFQKLEIPTSTIYSFNIINPILDEFTGYLYFQLNKLDLGKLDFNNLLEENNLRHIVVNFDNDESDIFIIKWNYMIQKEINSNSNYMISFGGVGYPVIPFENQKYKI